MYSDAFLFLGLKGKMYQIINPVKMRKVFLLLSVVMLFGACQKKEYPTFNFPKTGYLHQSLTEATTPVVATASPQALEAPQALSASVTGNDFIKEDCKAATNPAEAISFPYFSTDVVQDEKKATHSTVRKEPVRIKRSQPSRSTAIFHKKSYLSQEGKGENLGILSLVFGSVGVLVALSPMILSAPIELFLVGVVLGTIGMVMGFVYFRKIKKQRITSQNETAAIIGIVSGIVTFLAGIVVSLAYLILTSSFGF